ncbi:MAG: hypothetical protein Q9167_003322 [Letrouitia subvulpina]
MAQLQPQPDARIELQVGSRRFTCSVSTLIAGSTYFASLLSNRWEPPSDAKPYFIEGDPDLFVHILRYLSHGVLPVFYDKLKGFDYGTYYALQEEASYLGIKKLYDWIKRQCYIKAVSVNYRVTTLEGYGEEWCGEDFTIDADTEHTYIPAFGKKKVYVCPRLVAQHYGYPERCGRACHEYQGDYPDTYAEEAVWRTYVVAKRTIFAGTSSQAENVQLSSDLTTSDDRAGEPSDTSGDAGIGVVEVNAEDWQVLETWASLSLDPLARELVTALLRQPV